MVRFLGPERPAELIRGQLPNVVFSPGRVQAHLLGSGWGDRPDGADAVAAALDTGLPAVVDADGLRFLPDRLPASWLLTPHAGELARLLERDRSWVTEDPHRAVVEATARTGATVLLKGASQLVASPEHGWVGVAVPGPAWTAQAGSGDVLGGICATLLAAGLPAWQAGLLGASLQAVAARRHPGALPPHALAERLPETLGWLEARSGGRGTAR
jgi:NAD(P)H-hydrate repair Nnr-like enzyme with NAD(P)H-hydrate dehydratase domain